MINLCKLSFNNLRKNLKINNRNNKQTHKNPIKILTIKIPKKTSRNSNNNKMIKITKIFKINKVIKIHKTIKSILKNKKKTKFKQ